MNKFIALLCFVSLAVLGSGNSNFGIISPYSDLAEKIQQKLITNRQNFANGFNGLPPLDPITIDGPFTIDADPFKASVQSIQVTGLSSYNDTFLRILTNGVWMFVAEIPQIIVQGRLEIDVDPKNPYKGDVTATLNNMTVVVNGYATKEGDVLKISEIHSDVSINENPKVKVIGLPGSNQFLNSFASQYLTNNLGNMINNHSDIYEAALNAIIESYLAQAIGSSYSGFVNKLN